MKFKVIGKVYDNGEIRVVQYGDDFTDYQDAYDYKEWLENTEHWKNDMPSRPYIIYIEEIDAEDEDINNEY